MPDRAPRLVRGSAAARRASLMWSALAIVLVAACRGDDAPDGSVPTATATASTVTATATATATATTTSTATTGDYPQEVQLTDADNGSTIRLARTGRLTIALSSNPSTGFHWSVGEQTSAGITLVGSPRYVPPGSTLPVVGAPGTEVFTFEPVRSGSGAGSNSVQVVLEYRRDFEPGVAPAKTFRVAVEIR